MRHYAHKMSALAVGLLSSGALSEPAQAQHTLQECTWSLGKLSDAMKENAFKKLIPLERWHLSNCRQFMPHEDYLIHLGGLATALSGDNQHQEAIGISDRCLQRDSQYIYCLATKANALYRSGNRKESKVVAERAMQIGAISKIDIFAKQYLREILNAISIDLAATPRKEKETPVDFTDLLPSRVVVDSVRPNSIVIQGKITAATASQFEEATKKMAPQSDVHIYLQSIGGEVAASMRIGAAIRSGWFSTSVEHGVCVSACVFILAAGTERTIASEARVGIHRPYFEPAMFAQLDRETASKKYGELTGVVRSYLERMGMGEGLFRAMMAVPSGQMKYANAAELKSWGLEGADPAHDEWRRAKLKAKDFGKDDRIVSPAPK